jgi:hypothetical protein
MPGVATTLNSAGAKPCKKGWESCGTGCYDPKVSCCCKTKKGTWSSKPKAARQSCGIVCK